MTATFDLTSAERDIRTEDGFTTTLRTDGMTKSALTYLDFTVDGTPLLPQLANRAAGEAGSSRALRSVGLVALDGDELADVRNAA